MEIANLRAQCLAVQTTQTHHSRQLRTPSRRWSAVVYCLSSLHDKSIDDKHQRSPQVRKLLLQRHLYIPESVWFKANYIYLPNVTFPSFKQHISHFWHLVSAVNPLHFVSNLISHCPEQTKSCAHLLSNQTLGGPCIQKSFEVACEFGLHRVNPLSSAWIFKCLD